MSAEGFVSAAQMFFGGEKVDRQKVIKRRFLLETIHFQVLCWTSGRVTIEIESKNIFWAKNPEN